MSGESMAQPGIISYLRLTMPDADETIVTPSMPEAEAEHLRNAYRRASVILEYGSGGSTRLASQMPGKLVLSVESDLAWARALRREIANAAPLSPAVVYHVDIGPTGRWGRPVDESGWKRYHCYPNAIWDEPFFRHPDVVLIDGRFRPACLVATMLHATRPVTVLFDDYIDRPRYRLVETFLAPVRLIGRMAEFHVTPGGLHPRDVGRAIGMFFDVTVQGKGPTSYGVAPDGAAAPDIAARRSTT